MTQRLILVLIALGIAVVVAAGRGRTLGEDIFYNANPPCIACHNAQRGNLAYSRMPPDEMAYWIRNGIDDRMPGYRLTEPQMAALIEYVMSLRQRK